MVPWHPHCVFMEPFTPHGIAGPPLSKYGTRNSLCTTRGVDFTIFCDMCCDIFAMFFDNFGKKKNKQTKKKLHKTSFLRDTASGPCYTPTNLVSAFISQNMIRFRRFKTNLTKNIKKHINIYKTSKI